MCARVVRVGCVHYILGGSRIGNASECPASVCVCVCPASVCVCVRVRARGGGPTTDYTIHINAHGRRRLGDDAADGAAERLAQRLHDAAVAGDVRVGDKDHSHDGLHNVPVCVKTTTTT